MTTWVRRLIAINVGVFLLQMVWAPLTGLLELDPRFVIVRPWTIITYMFIHDTHNLFHILFNMYALWLFGTRVEERMGATKFIALYLLSGIGGGLASFVPPAPPVIGASGAIMGVMAAFASYWPRERFLIWGIIPVEAWLLVTAYVILDASGALGFGGGNTAHFAHLGGLITGFIYLKVTDLTSPARAWKKRVNAGKRPTPVVTLGANDPLRKWREIRLDDLHPVNREEIVRLLRKAQAEGPKSLTLEERATLNRFAGVN